MTSSEYYAALAKKYEQTNWNDRNSIREYNEYARMLRSQMERGDDDERDH